MGIGLAQSYEAFLVARILIGIIGASFVITQYHTSIMFAPNVVGTANATTAGWGNLGGGVTQLVMPLIFTGFIGLSFSSTVSWRLCMLVAGLVILLSGIAYFFLTQDAPEGNFARLRADGIMPAPRATKGTFLEAARDIRVWALFILYGACFGLELTIDNIAALYFADYFSLPLVTAGIIASLFGLMNIFARTLGGVLGDYSGNRWGLKGRVRWLLLVVLIEGISLIIFSQMRGLVLAIGALMLFSLFVQMACGATFSVVPFINKRALGSVSGIVGAGGNVGAFAAGFLFRSDNWPLSLLILGVVVIVASLAVLVVRFSPMDEAAARAEMEARLREQEGELVPSMA
jgi:NNP family nitrate/nitrite transporter-like MFS transporter